MIVTQYDEDIRYMSDCIVETAKKICKQHKICANCPFNDNEAQGDCIFEIYPAEIAEAEKRAAESIAEAAEKAGKSALCEPLNDPIFPTVLPEVHEEFFRETEKALAAYIDGPEETSYSGDDTDNPQTEEERRQYFRGLYRAIELMGLEYRYYEYRCREDVRAYRSE